MSGNDERGVREPLTFEELKKLRKMMCDLIEYYNKHIEWMFKPDPLHTGLLEWMLDERE